MQNTYDTNGEGLPDFPNDLAVTDVNVYVHDSGMVASHDYSCPCCRKRHAVLSLGTGIMQPCWGCQEKGFKIVKIEKKKNPVSKWIASLFGA